MSKDARQYYVNNLFYVTVFFIHPMLTYGVQEVVSNNV